MYIFINGTKHNWVETKEKAQQEVDFLTEQFKNSPDNYLIEIR